MARVLKSPSARANWRDVLDQVKEADVVIERYGAPVVAIIPYEDYNAIREQLENLRAVRQAKSAYAQVQKSQPAGAPSGRDVPQTAPQVAAPVQAAAVLALEDINAKLEALQVEVAALRRQVALDI